MSNNPMSDKINQSETGFIFLRQGASSIISALESYANQVHVDATDSLSPKLRGLIGLAIGLIIPSKPLVKRYLLEVKGFATKAEIAETFTAAAALRAGGAIGYGRLVFKLTESQESLEPEGDRSRIQRDRQYMTQLRKANPGAFDGLARFMEALHKPNLALPAKHYELIAVAGATITQCIYCLEKHVNDARKAGASDREIADVVHVAVVSRAEAVLSACDEYNLNEIFQNLE